MWAVRERGKVRARQRERGKERGGKREGEGEKKGREREKEKRRERKKGRKKEEKERKRATLLRGKLHLTHYMSKYRISGALQYTCLDCESKCVYLHLVKVEPSISILSISRTPP